MLWMVSRFTLFLSVVSIGLFACFCHKTTFYQLGGSDHSVLDTTAQLTEGRSARDQPKQPPAKKINISFFSAGWVLGIAVYTAVYALPTVWPDVSMMGINNLRKNLIDNPGPFLTATSAWSIYDQVREEEHVISVSFLEVSKMCQLGE